jgi:Phage integrase family
MNWPFGFSPAFPGKRQEIWCWAQKLSVYTKRLFASLRIAEASFHSLRHTATSWLVMQGVDLYAVGQLLGHRTPRMSQRCAHLSPQYVAGGVGKLDSVFREVMPESTSSMGLLEGSGTAERFAALMRSLRLLWLCFLLLNPLSQLVDCSLDCALPEDRRDPGFSPKRVSSPRI